MCCLKHFAWEDSYNPWDRNDTLSYRPQELEKADQLGLSAARRGVIPPIKKFMEREPGPAGRIRVHGVRYPRKRCNYDDYIGPSKK